MKVDVTDTVDYLRVWQEGMKDWDGQMPDRMTDDQAEEAFWSGFMKEKDKNDSVDLYAKKVQTAISYLVKPTDKVLEIGPGWGNYTFHLTESVQQVTCVDSSRSVLDFLQQSANRKEIKNLDFIHEKWEDFSPEPDSWDVVFGMNCFYRMYEIEKTIKLINQSASRLAIMGMTTGPLQPHYLELSRTHGYQLKFPRRDYILLQNILYEMGIYAHCQMIPLVKTYTYHSFDDLVERNLSQIREKAIDRSKVEAALKKYVIFDGDKYHYHHTFHAALLYWQPVDCMKL